MARQIYYDFIYSRVQYGIEVYSSCSETHINRLQVIQNKLSKLIHNLDRLTATIILYKEINILKVTHIDESSVLGFVNKVLCGQCPAIFLSYYVSKHQPRASKVKHTSNTLQMDVSPVFHSYAAICTGAIPAFGKSFTLQRRLVKLNNNDEVGDNQSNHLQANMKQKICAASCIDITLS